MTDGLKNLFEQQKQLENSLNCAQNGFAVLTDWQAIQINGDDAESFLQNLLTNDVKTAEATHAQLNGLCQAKGRLLAIFWLIRRQDDFVIFLPADQTDFLIKRLNMFKLRSNVSITIMTNYALLALHGINDLPKYSYQMGTNTAIVIVSAAQLEKPLKQLQHGGFAQQASHFWQQALLRAGYPMIFAASRERFTAQQVNLDLAGGISFRKGCYPGQEVVARLHYLGEPKRRLFIGEAMTTNLPAPGTDINTAEGEVAGQLVQACPIDSNHSLVQLTLKLSAATQTLFLSDGIEISSVLQLGGD